MKKTHLILIFVFALFLNACKPENQKTKESDSPTVAAIQHKSFEIPGIQVIPIQDTQTNRQYELYIKLPEGYSENNDAKYPVVYFTDAMWHIEILSGSIEYLMKNAILVGISWEKNIKDAEAHTSRYRDFTIMKSNNPEQQAKYQLGQASNHLTFIRNDVIKYVENNYRTDPDNRTYFGYSLGGLFGAYVLLEQPDTFKNYILGSPAFASSKRHIFELESNAAKKRKDLNANVFISVGALENTYIGPIEDFISKLKSRNYAGLSLQEVVIIESADHGRAFPMSAVRGMYWLSDLTKE